MRYFITILMFLLAVPVVAQEGNPCGERKSFQLTDGSIGCLLEISQSHFTRSRTVDNSPDWSKEVPSIFLHVAMFGEYSTKWRSTTPRHKEICKTFLDQIKTEQAGTKYRNIITHMSWPGVEQPESANSEEFAFQSAFLTKSCRSVQYFGTRSN